MSKRTIMIFGVGELQKSIINRAHLMGLRVVGIDPCENAFSKEDVDVFEVVGGQDYEGTIEAARRNHVSAIVTAATDKPLVMMARVAKELGYSFFSEETAIWSTDKFLMKQRFLEGGIPCAQGRLIHTAEEAKDLCFPIICKPRDSSGSRGVKLCRNIHDLQECIDEALRYSSLDTVLVEEFIEGHEFSIESLHYDGKSEVIQFTEKKTTEFPYSVEIEHLQPADLSEEQKTAIRVIIEKIGRSLKFENCPSHTELKINERGIFIIETSPRLGGDYITSTLVPLSTGINIEDQVLNLALGKQVDIKTGRVERASGVRFFCLPEGRLYSIDNLFYRLKEKPGVVLLDFRLKVGEIINRITNSLNRYGEIVISADCRDVLNDILMNCSDVFEKSMMIQNEFDDLFVGQSYSLTHMFSKEDVDGFSELSLDRNPLHLDSKYAQQSYFKRNIVHGFLSSSLISAIIGTKMPGVGSIYLKQDLVFKRPVFINETITANVTITELNRDKRIIYLKTTCYKQSGTVVVDGSAVVKLNS